MIRVTRLMEYEYADAEAMSRDTVRWTHNLVLPDMTMRSAVLLPVWVEDLPADPATTPTTPLIEETTT